MVAAPKLSCDAWFDWAEKEITQPGGIEAVLIGAIKNMIPEERSGFYFNPNSELGKLERKHQVAPQLDTKYPHAAEELTAFLIERIGQNRSNRQFAIRISEELCDEQTLPDSAVARLGVALSHLTNMTPRITPTRIGRRDVPALEKFIAEIQPPSLPDHIHALDRAHHLMSGRKGLRPAA